MDKIKTGIPGLDEILEGGIPRKTNVLIVGGTGTGKTILCSQFLYKGVEEYNQNGIFVTLEERAQDLRREMASFGWDFAKYEKEGRLALIDGTSVKLRKKKTREKYALVGMDIDALVIEINRVCKEINAERVVLDSVPSLGLNLDSEKEIRSSIYRLSTLLLEIGVTSFMTTETLDEGFSRYGVEEFVSRGVIKLDIAERENKFVRTIYVRKMRETNFSMEKYPFGIESDGIKIYTRGEVF
ncbi:MAG: ATPase domain-containing protein [Euryarchaeota archaeon]|nr:ATPase domain-containing protein [Euryarchaeota archaeon]